jgi:hypothetical protein
MAGSRRIPWIVSPLVVVLASCAGISGPGDLPATPGQVTIASNPVTSATVGTAVTELPAVLALDKTGKPIAGITVVFRASGGQVSGDTATTNSVGVATLGSWLLPVVAGENIVSATVSGFIPLRFKAIGGAGPPAGIQKLGGDNPFVIPESSVLSLPRVRITDKYGNPAGGVAVRFTIVQGGGSLAGAETFSDSLGFASLSGWKIGKSGDQVVAAQVLGVEPVFFVSKPRILVVNCQTIAEIVIQNPLNSDLGAGDCRNADGRYFKLFLLNQQATSATLVTLRSTAFDGYVEMRNAAGDPIAVGDHIGQVSTSVSFRAILPKGTYFLVVSSQNPEAVGQFQLSYSFTSSYDECSDTFIAPAFVVDQQMVGKNCSTKPAWVDRYRVHLNAGQFVTFTVDDRSYNGPLVELFDGSGVRVATEEVMQFYTHVIRFTTPSEGFYKLQVTGSDEELIQYGLTVK